MNQEERRQEILDCIRGSDTPVSGTWLAGKCGVSRQIIVQDMTSFQPIRDISAGSRHRRSRCSRYGTRISRLRMN